MSCHPLLIVASPDYCFFSSDFGVKPGGKEIAGGAVLQSVLSTEAGLDYVKSDDEQRNAV